MKSQSPNAAQWTGWDREGGGGELDLKLADEEKNLAIPPLPLTSLAGTVFALGTKQN